MARFPFGGKDQDDGADQPAEAAQPAEQPDTSAMPEQSASPGGQPQGEEPTPVGGEQPITHAAYSPPWEQSRGEPRSESRVSVVDEQPPRPAPPKGASEDEYQWHT
jgi:hypothetical protein